MAHARADHVDGAHTEDLMKTAQMSDEHERRGWRRMEAGDLATGVHEDSAEMGHRRRRSAWTSDAATSTHL
jgi:hypothetical protein